MTGSLASRFWQCVGLVAIAAVLVACGQTDDGGIAPAALPVSKSAVMLMQQKGMTTASPIFIRIFKEESELELWKARDDGHFYHFKTYPICNWSGELGPKLSQGDRQAPEGFYNITSAQLNPKSNYYLSFNVGFPNAYDRAYGRTGSSVMVHGNCKSAGCYAMTDALVEEIYGVVRDALSAGEKQIPLHAYPFRMTETNMKRHAGNQWMPFWKQLKQGYDYFEIARKPPAVAVCSKQYLVNAQFTEGAPEDASEPCPAFVHPKPELWLAEEQKNPGVLLQQAKAPGIKTRNLAQEQAFAQKQGAGKGGWGASTSVNTAAMGFGGVEVAN